MDAQAGREGAEPAQPGDDRGALPGAPAGHRRGRRSGARVRERRTQRGGGGAGQKQVLICFIYLCEKGNYNFVPICIRHYLRNIFFPRACAEASIVSALWHKLEADLEAEGMKKAFKSMKTLQLSPLFYQLFQF